MIATRLALVILLWSRLIFGSISPELVRSIAKSLTKTAQSYGQSVFKMRTDASTKFRPPLNR